jgi:hypothetical protein
MSELKQKKVARDQALEKANKEAATKAAAAAEALNKSIFEKAKAYEQEYEKVGVLIFSIRKDFSSFGV